MKTKKFAKTFYEGGKTLYEKPVVILLGVLMWAALFGISQLGRVLAPQFQTTASNVVWTIIVAVISFAIGTAFLVGLIAIASKEGKRGTGREFSGAVQKFWLRGFLILIFILAISFLIGRIAHYAALHIGRAAELATSAAVVVFVLVYFIGLVGVLVFLTFSHFLMVLKKMRVHTAVAASVKLVGKEYPSALALNVVFFLLFLAFDMISHWSGDILLFGLLVPYFIAVLTRFVEEA